MEIGITVIMPSLNVVDYIDESIQSVLNQTMTNIEIICVDAGSEDGTIKKIEKYSKDLRYSNKLRLIKSDIKSYGYQVNLGMKYAKGKYVAIVETDDFVSRVMYENLYQVAEKYSCDYVKANYDTFWTTTDGIRIFEKQMLYEKGAKEYNRPLNVCEHIELLCKDINVWKGIYNLEFLKRHNIWFNESAGAAYQDIGFLQQVYWYTDKAVFMEQSYYRYCTDRDTSSTNEGNGLRFAYQEYERLLSQKISLNVKEGRYDCIYLHMAEVFLWNLQQAIDRGDLEANKEYIDWFVLILKEQMRNGTLVYPLIEGMLQDKEEWMRNFVSDTLKKKQYNDILCNGLVNKRVVVFGSGIRGRACYKLLDQNGIIVDAFCDNNAELWGSKIGAKLIIAPIDAKRQYDNNVFVIASKFHSKEIERQLKDYGIKDSNIICFKQ